MARRSPTLTLVVLLVAVYLVEVVVDFFGPGPAAFALAPPVTARPWTIVTSVYAHSGPGHLLANLVGLVLIGVFLERKTSPARFHAFFLGSGAVAGLAQVWLSGFVGARVAVLGASGAVFALLGYVLAGNRVADTVFRGVSVPPRLQLLGFALVAGGVTLATGGPGVALVSHFTGLLIGLLAGRAHLLRPE
jgi:membrane associated rhomboid family serine protease